MRRRLRHALLGLAAAVLAAGSAPSCASAASEPLGMVVWTDLQGASSSVKYYIYTPSDHFPPSMPRFGTFSYQTELSGGDPFTFMHSAFDNSGVRLLFSSGQGVNPTLQAPPAAGFTLGAPTTKILKYHQAGDVLAAASGGRCFFNPAPDHVGRFALYNSFETGAQAGFRLWRVSLTGGGEQDLGADFQGGLWPVLSLDDKMVAFARRLSYATPQTYTPISVGLYVAGIDPATGAPTGSPQLATPDVEDTFDSDWGAGQKFTGPIRVGRAAWGPDNRTLIFAMQDARAGSPDTSWSLFKTDVDASGAPSGTITRLGAQTPNTNEFWPSVSADGEWVCFVQQVINSTQYHVILARADDLSSPRPVASPPQGDVSVWPAFDQDNDPPNVEVRLTFGDSNQFTSIRVVDEEPDHFESGACRDRFLFRMQGQNFHDSLSVLCSPTTTAELEWPKPAASLPAKLLIGLTTKQAQLGKGMDDADFHCLSEAGWFTPVPPPGLPADYTQIGGKALEGIFIEEGVRFKFDVLARDNRYLRPKVVTPFDSAPPGWGAGVLDPASFRWDVAHALYDDDSWERAQSPSVTGRNADPPYFPRVPKQHLEEKYPGVCWWVEDTEGKMIQGTDGAPFHIFRKANYPPSAKYPEYSQNKPYRIRIVAQDLWLNRTEIAIPVWVWDTKEKVKGLDYGTQRQK